MKLQYDEPLSKFAFKFNLRRYNEAFKSPAELKLHEVGPAGHSL